MSPGETDQKRDRDSHPIRKPSSTIDFTTSINIVKTVLKKKKKKKKKKKSHFEIIYLQLYIIFREYEH